MHALVLSAFGCGAFGHPPWTVAALFHDALRDMAGTLEEVVELLSWRRLDLHRKPIVFLDQKGFWQPFFALIDHTIEGRLTPEAFRAAYRSVAQVEDLLPTLRTMLEETRGLNMMPGAADLT